MSGVDYDKNFRRLAEAGVFHKLIESSDRTFVPASRDKSLGVSKVGMYYAEIKVDEDDPLDEKKNNVTYDDKGVLVDRDGRRVYCMAPAGVVSFSRVSPLGALKCMEDPERPVGKIDWYSDDVSDAKRLIRLGADPFCDSRADGNGEDIYMREFFSLVSRMERWMFCWLVKSLLHADRGVVMGILGNSTYKKLTEFESECAENLRKSSPEYTKISIKSSKDGVSYGVKSKKSEEETKALLDRFLGDLCTGLVAYLKSESNTTYNKMGKVKGVTFKQKVCFVTKKEDKAKAQKDWARFEEDMKKPLNGHPDVFLGDYMAKTKAALKDYPFHLTHMKFQEMSVSRGSVHFDQINRADLPFKGITGSVVSLMCTFYVSVDPKVGFCHRLHDRVILHDFRKREDDAPVSSSFEVGEGVELEEQEGCAKRIRLTEEASQDPNGDLGGHFADMDRLEQLEREAMERN